jgi:CubicO group peptidase (beta-lactamase class C family)
MTAASIGMLVDEGKVRWDDPVTNYLPTFQLRDPWATRETTVRDLLTHRAGLPNIDFLWYGTSNTTTEILRRVRFVDLAYSPRSSFIYQNVMYAAAGQVIASASGMPWDEFVRTRIFAPLHMDRTVPLLARAATAPNVARPHDIIDDTMRVITNASVDPVASAGAVWSSVADMSKWMRFILDSGRVGNRRLIKPATFREIVAPQMRAPMTQYPALALAQPHFFSYALGWFVQDYHGETVWMHTGSIDGMCAIIGLLPERHVGVYILENVDHAELRHALMYKVFDMYRAQTRAPARDWSADLKAHFDSLHTAQRATVAAAEASAKTKSAGASPSLPLDRYAGSYVDSTYGNITVAFANGALRARFVNFDIGELKHGTFETFQSVKDDPLEGATELTFVPDGSGHVSAVQAFGVTFNRSTSESKPE